MDHNPLPVHGYKPQSGESVELVNKNKMLEEQTLRILDSLKLRKDVDQRWLAVGRTHIEQAWMAINRSIFQPKRATLPEDAS
jgi:hypothetical protein